MFENSNQAVGIVSDIKYLNQTIFLISQIRKYLRKTRICILLLEKPNDHRLIEKLKEYNVEIELFDWKNNYHNSIRTGLKLCIPDYFNAECYILLDSDTYILKRDFFSSLITVPNKISLVKETDIVWLEGFNGVNNINHKQIIGRPIFQTGLITLYRSFWELNKEKIFNLIEKDDSYWGDMVAINQFCYRNLKLVNPLDESVHLVLRSDNKGRSTLSHIIKLSWNNGILSFENSPVLSIHYTNSDGKLLDINSFTHGT